MAQKVLFWDFDGTLGYRVGGMWSSALHEALLDFDPNTTATVESFIPLLRDGFPWHQPEIEHTEITTAESWWLHLRSTVMEKAYCTLGFTKKQAEQLALAAQVKYVETSHWAIYDDVMPVLESLTDQGWTHAIVSNHVPELQKILTHVGLAGYISDVINSAFAGYEKPHPQLFRIALEKLGNPADVWMIGDNPVADVFGAEHAGIKGILVRNQDHRVVRQCKTLYEVPSVMRLG